MILCICGFKLCFNTCYNTLIFYKKVSERAKATIQLKKSTIQLKKKQKSEKRFNF